MTEHPQKIRRPIASLQYSRKSRCPTSRFWDMGSRTVQAFALVLLFTALLAPPLHAQGCTQCRDNTAATPPATQRAYRHAIILMVVAGGTLFLATLTLFKRQP
jgi:hypothetical protein